MRDTKKEDVLIGQVKEIPYTPELSLYRQGIHSEKKLEKLKGWLKESNQVVIRKGRTGCKVFSVLDLEKEVSILELPDLKQCSKYINQYDLKLV